MWTWSGRPPLYSPPCQCEMEWKCHAPQIFPIRSVGEHSFVNVSPNVSTRSAIMKFLCTQKLHCMWMTASNLSHWCCQTCSNYHPLTAHKLFHKNNDTVKWKALVKHLLAITSVCSIKIINKIKVWVPLILKIEGNSNIPSGMLVDV